MPSQYSVLSARSSTECSAQKLPRDEHGRRLPDHGLAAVLAELGRLALVRVRPAQLMQSKPPFWFRESMSLAVRASPSCSIAGPIECRTPGTPAAQSLGSPTVISASVTSSFGAARSLGAHCLSGLLGLFGSWGCWRRALLLPRRGVGRRERRFDDPLGSAVDDHALAAQEADDRDADLLRQVDGERRGAPTPPPGPGSPPSPSCVNSKLARPDTIRTVPLRGSLPSLTAHPTTLSTALWRPTSSRRRHLAAPPVEQRRGVQPTGLLEHVLRRPSRSGNVARSAGSSTRSSWCTACCEVVRTASMLALPHSPQELVV